MVPTPTDTPPEAERDITKIIWRENDKRFERYVRIVGAFSRVGPDKHAIKQCRVDGKIIGHNTTYAAVSAFGRRYKGTGHVD